MFKHDAVSLIISTTATMMRMIYYLHGNIQTHRSVTAVAAEMSGAICDSCAIVQIVYDIPLGFSENFSQTVGNF